MTDAPRKIWIDTKKKNWHSGKETDRRWFYKATEGLQSVAYIRDDLATANAEELRKVLESIRDNDPDCSCDHSDSDCCVLIAGVFCPRCIAAAVLAETGGEVDG